METAREAVSFAPALLVMVTMFGTFALLRFHTKNARGRANSMRAASQQGEDFYQRLFALEIMAVREAFECTERQEKAEQERLAELAIDLTVDTEQLYREPAEADNTKATDVIADSSSAATKHAK